jgi:hypothetical protein
VKRRIPQTPGNSGLTFGLRPLARTWRPPRQIAGRRAGSARLASSAIPRNGPCAIAAGEAEMSILTPLSLRPAVHPHGLGGIDPTGAHRIDPRHWLPETRPSVCPAETEESKMPYPRGISDRIRGSYGSGALREATAIAMDSAPDRKDRCEGCHPIGVIGRMREYHQGRTMGDGCFVW